MKKQNRVHENNKAIAHPPQRKARRQLSSLEVILLSDLYDQFEGQPFHDAISNFAALAELLAENRAPEVRAIKTMVKAERALNQIRTKCRNI